MLHLVPQIATILQQVLLAIAKLFVLVPMLLLLLALLMHLLPSAVALSMYGYNMLVHLPQLMPH